MSNEMLLCYRIYKMKEDGTKWQRREKAKRVLAEFHTLLQSTNPDGFRPHRENPQHCRKDDSQKLIAPKTKGISM